MIGRLVRSVDFERVLRCPPRAKSAHFAVHHLAGVPTPAAKRPAKPESQKLSTAGYPDSVQPVDDCGLAAPGGAPNVWLGLVLPKRHARRSVTRSLLKRRIRSAVSAAESQLPVGLWVVRLRSPFERTQFPAAASAALGGVAGEELAALMQRAIGRPVAA